MAPFNPEAISTVLTAKSLKHTLLNGILMKQSIELTTATFTRGVTLHNTALSNISLDRVLQRQKMRSG